MFSYEFQNYDMEKEYSQKTCCGILLKYVIDNN